MQPPGVKLHARLAQHLHLFQQGARVDHHAVAQHGDDLRMDDTGGDEVQFIDLIPHRYGVSGVVASIVTGGESGIGGEPIHDASLALVAPLGTHNDL